MSFQPEVYGKYYLVDRIAVGGMAEIFKAKIFGPGGFEKLLVIKRILLHLSQDEDFVDMFMDEARISSTLNHSNIVHIFDFGKIKDNYFIAMEYLEGRDLKTVMKKCQRSRRLLPVEFAVYIVHEMCKALDHAHNKKDAQNRELNILHRDISPSNVLISYDEGRVKLADFGIAKAEGATYKTQAGVLKGKFEYMSPEQASGKKVDRRSDLFAAGIVLYELLTRRRLFKAANDLETLEMIRNPRVPPPSHLNPEISPELDAIVMKALASDPEERYQEAWELQRDLRAFMRPNSPDLIAQNLTRFMEELFQKEIEEERERLERGSKLIREAIKTGSMAEELALDDHYVAPTEDGSFDHPQTQISFEFAARERDPRRLSALIALLVTVAVGAGAFYFLGRGPAEDPAVAVAPRPGVGQAAVPAQDPAAAQPRMGTLVVVPEPVGAKVFLDGDLIGETSPVSREVALGKVYELRVESPGFARQKRTFTVTDEAPTAFLPVILVAEAEAQAQARPAEPAPQETARALSAPTRPAATTTQPSTVASRPPTSGSGRGGVLKLDSSPTGADAFVDGEFACRTPCTHPVKEADQRVKVAFRLAGYELSQSSLTVPADAEVPVQARLSRAEMGKLSVTLTEQVPVEIYVDGLRQGHNVMISALPLTAGHHDVLLRNPSLGIRKTLSVEIEAGKHLQLTDVDPRN